VDADSILKGLKSVTKKWTRQRTKEVRSARAASRRPYMYTARSTATEILHEVIPPAYVKVSDNGDLPAHARQIMYACRNEIQDHTGQPLDDKYFTQTLLPDFVNDRPDLTAGWDVVYDARGHFLVPHTGEEVALSTLDVRQYLRGGEQDRPVKVRGLFPTHGPENRFGAVLFVEKEGFLPLFHRVHLAQRYDLAILSSKGMSTVAARALVDQLCGRDGVPLLVAHDFDKAGFSILATLTRSNRRYLFAHCVEATDLGLRLPDVARLQDEDSFLTGDGHRDTLRRNGASPDEIEFLVDQRRRVELNAFTSRGLVDWLEGKLQQHGVKKVVPGPEVLEEAYRRAFIRESVRKAAREAREQAERWATNRPVPEHLGAKVGAKLQEWPRLPWDLALAQIVKNELAREGD
jgi:hypothetical protein